MARGTGGLSDYFSGKINNVFETAFPGIGEFASAVQNSFTKEKDEDEKETSNQAKAPPSPSSGMKSNRFNQAILDELIDMNQQIKNTNHVATVQLEFQGETNRLLRQILGRGGMGSGPGGDSSAGGAGGLIKDAEEVAGELWLFKQFKNFMGIGKGVVGGAVGAVAGGTTSVAVGLAGVAAGGGMLYKAYGQQQEEKKNYGDEFVNDASKYSQTYKSRNMDENYVTQNMSKILKEIQEGKNEEISSSKSSNQNQINNINQRTQELQDSLKERTEVLNRIKKTDSQYNDITRANIDTQKEIADLQNQKKDLLKQQNDLDKAKIENDKKTADDQKTFKDMITSMSTLQTGRLAHGFGIHPDNPYNDITGRNLGSVQEGQFQRLHGSFNGNGAGIQASGGIKSTGTLRSNQEKAYAAFKSGGMSDDAAKLAVANLSGESLTNPSNVHSDPSGSNPNQKAHGIASWDDSRSARIQKQFGKMPNEMSVEEQAKAYMWEMKTYYPQTWNDLNNSNMTASQRMFSQVKNFEAPANPYGDTSHRLGIYNGLGNLGKSQTGTATMAAPGDSKAVLDHLDEMKKRGMITNEQCVSLATAAVGIPLGSGQAGGNVHDWTKAGDVTGKTAAGTPIATFLDNNYRPSNRYAGGGSGTPGANKDHAAVLTGNYHYNDKGEVIGAEITDQSAGHGWQGQTHWISATGPEGSGGEQNLNNFHLIGASGGLLGGANNPEQQRRIRESDSEKGKVNAAGMKQLGVWANSVKNYFGDKKEPTSQVLAEINYTNRARHNMVADQNESNIRDMGINATYQNSVKNAKNSLPSTFAAASNGYAAQKESIMPQLANQFMTNHITSDPKSGLTKGTDSGIHNKKDAGQTHPPKDYLQELFTRKSIYGAQ